MGYIGSSPYFFIATETAANLANKAISHREQADEHLLELAYEARAADNINVPETQADRIWEHLPEEQRAAAKANINV